MAETNVPGKQVRNQTIRNIDWDPSDPISWENVDKTGASPADIGAAPNHAPVFTGHVTVPTPTLPHDAVTKHYVDILTGTPGAVIEFSVRSRTSDGPDRTSIAGDVYIVPTGVSYPAWLGHDLDIAEYAGASSWTFTDASSGWSAYVEDEFKYYTFMGGTWVRNTQLIYPYGVTGSVLTVDASGNPAWVYDTDTGSATYSASAYFSSVAGSASYASQAASSNLALNLSHTVGASAGAVLTSNASGDAYWANLGDVLSLSPKFIYYGDSPYYQQIEKEMILANAATGDITIRLLPVDSVIGKTYYMKKTDVTRNVVTIVASGSEIIDDANTYLLELQNEFVQVQSDGVKWQVMAE